MKVIIFSISLLATSSFASEKSSDKCGIKAVEAALAIAKVNGVKGGAMFPTTVFIVESIPSGEEYSSRSTFRVGNANNIDDVYFSYRVEIGDGSGLGGSPCEVISVTIPQP